MRLFILFFFISALTACNAIKSSRSNQLRNERIENLLIGEKNELKLSYRQMAMHEISDSHFKLVYYWKEKIVFRQFSKDPCTSFLKKPIKLSGEGFAAFHSAILEAIHLDASAISIGPKENGLNKVEFFKCGDVTGIGEKPFDIKWN